MSELMLSDHFSYAETIHSDTAERTGISNTPDEDTLERMYKTALAMERVRAVLDNKPVHTNSWYRCLQLNRAIGSNDSSQHTLGEAVDFICPTFGSPLEICKALIAHSSNIRFDQLILEHTWVHVSFGISTGRTRNQVLTLLANKSYAVGLTDNKGNPA